MTSTPCLTLLSACTMSTRYRYICYYNKDLQCIFSNFTTELNKSCRDVSVSHFVVSVEWSRVLLNAFIKCENNVFFSILLRIKINSWKCRWIEPGKDQRHFIPASWNLWASHVPGYVTKEMRELRVRCRGVYNLHFHQAWIFWWKEKNLCLFVPWWYCFLVDLSHEANVSFGI